LLTTGLLTTGLLTTGLLTTGLLTTVPLTTGPLTTGAVGAAVPARSAGVLAPIAGTIRSSGARRVGIGLLLVVYAAVRDAAGGVVSAAML
ncbi:MAG TPA: hypothetical protein VHF26_27270, partial [Trebonia sp.]|nr:hypothetical protein [Trebonia sp.]